LVSVIVEVGKAEGPGEGALDGDGGSKGSIEGCPVVRMLGEPVGFLDGYPVGEWIGCSPVVTERDGASEGEPVVRRLGLGLEKGFAIGAKIGGLGSGE